MVGPTIHVKWDVLIYGTLGVFNNFFSVTIIDLYIWIIIHSINTLASEILNYSTGYYYIYMIQSHSQVLYIWHTQNHIDMDKPKTPFIVVIIIIIIIIIYRVKEQVFYLEANKIQCT